jgi:hypothetical protein
MDILTVYSSFEIPASSLSQQVELIRQGKEAESHLLQKAQFEGRLQ